jgi:hypothetical protein
MEPLRDIEGPYFGPVNNDYLVIKTRRRTTHIRLYTESKQKLLEKARENGMTVPKYVEKMVKEYHSLSWVMTHL